MQLLVKLTFFAQQYEPKSNLNIFGFIPQLNQNKLKGEKNIKQALLIVSFVITT